MLRLVSDINHQHENYWGDKRKWIAPEVFIDFSSDYYKNSDDLMMNEIIEYLKNCFIQKNK